MTHTRSAEALGDPIPDEHAFAGHSDGERLGVNERIVVSPAAGRFGSPHDVAALAGRMVEVGFLFGTVGREEVRSPFAGRFMGMLAWPGERVASGEPIAWLREE